jgi:hypothetical protein
MAKASKAAPKKSAKKTIEPSGLASTKVKSRTAKKNAPKTINLTQRSTSNAVNITHAKVIKNQTLDIKFNKTESDGTKTTTVQSRKANIHQDLRNAFASLRIHFAILCDFISTRMVRDVTKFDVALVKDFNVHGLSIGGDEDDQGFQLTGTKTLPNGKVITINTAFQRFDEDDKTQYKYIGDLTTKIDVIKSEVLEYMDGKHAPDPQQSLFPGETEVSNPNPEPANDLPFGDETSDSVTE